MVDAYIKDPKNGKSPFGFVIYKTQTYVVSSIPLILYFVTMLSKILFRDCILFNCMVKLIDIFDIHKVEIL